MKATSRLNETPPIFLYPLFIRDKRFSMSLNTSWISIMTVHKIHRREIEGDSLRCVSPRNTVNDEGQLERVQKQIGKNKGLDNWLNDLPFS